jgi:hypothetical protein
MLGMTGAGKLEVEAGKQKVEIGKNKEGHPPRRAPFCRNNAERKRQNPHPCVKQKRKDGAADELAKGKSALTCLVDEANARGR